MLFGKWLAVIIRFSRSFENLGFLFCIVLMMLRIKAFSAGAGLDGLVTLLLLETYCHPR